MIDAETIDFEDRLFTCPYCGKETIVESPMDTGFTTGHIFSQAWYDVEHKRNCSGCYDLAPQRTFHEEGDPHAR